MYESHNEAELAAFGLTLADVAADSIEVWPDNWTAVSAFSALGTQWRVGFGGATGLDYGAIEPVLRMQCVKRAEWAGIFESIRVMERAALEVMRENKQ